MPLHEFSAKQKSICSPRGSMCRNDSKKPIKMRGQCFRNEGSMLKRIYTEPIVFLAWQREFHRHCAAQLFVISHEYDQYNSDSIGLRTGYKRNTP